MSTFSSQLLYLSDRIQQLRDALAPETLSERTRKHLSTQLAITERALKRALEEEHERRRHELPPDSVKH
jgi:hypothetical protein